jgi:hypothetical protein
MSHTVTFYLKLGGSLWTNESRLDTKDEWIDVAEFDVIVTPVKSVETNINIEGLRGWVLGIDATNFTSREVTLDNDSITILICKSDLNVGAVTSWASEVLTGNSKIGTLGVLGYTISWINLGDSWTIVESKVSANVLPILIILIDLNYCLSSVF